MVNLHPKSTRGMKQGQIISHFVGWLPVRGLKTSVGILRCLEICFFVYVPPQPNTWTYGLYDRILGSGPCCKQAQYDSFSNYLVYLVCLTTTEDSVPNFVRGLKQRSRCNSVECNMQLFQTGLVGLETGILLMRPGVGKEVGKRGILRGTDILGMPRKRNSNRSTYSLERERACYVCNVLYDLMGQALFS